MYVRSSPLIGMRGLGDALVSSLGSAIRQVEGYNPNFAPNNNPGNLIYIGPNQNGQTGVTKGAGGFARFTSPEAGQAAMDWQIQNYINRGYDLETFFTTWAPPNTKNEAGGAQTAEMTRNYIFRVSSMVGLDPNIPLKSVQGSYFGPGSVGSSSGGGDSSSFSSGDWLSSSDPSVDSSDVNTYDIGGIVLSGPELLLLGGVLVASIVVFSIL